MATPTSAWASAGASLVPSPHMATSLPLACSARISFSLASGVAWARKSSTPASAAMAAAVIGLSPVIITVRMPIRRSSAKRSRMPPLTMSLRWMTPSRRPSSRHGERRAAGLGDVGGDRLDLAHRVGGHGCSVAPPAGRPAAAAPTKASTASTAPLRMGAPPISTPLIRRLRGERARRWRGGVAMSRPRMPYFSLASTTIERPSGVSSASEASWAASASSWPADAAHRPERGRLAVAQRDGAGLVEQQRIDVARRLDGAARTSPAR